MVTVLTSHNHIWQSELVVASIIQEYQATGQVTVFMNKEGPCCDSVGMYSLLDNICEIFKFDPARITIVTHNAEELSDRYNIEIHANHWRVLTVESSISNGFNSKDFHLRKFPIKNLFGCLYNIPSWNRLSLLSYIKFNTKHSSLLACNGTWEPYKHNSYYLDPVTDYAPEEIFNIVKLISSSIGPLPQHPGHKPDSWENTKILNFYHDFFIDVVAETYTNGLTFFPTEKTFRPMFAYTPFIVFGPQGFLSNLKARYGFRTFNAWWDESYDECQQYDRIKKMYEVISYIDNQSDAELEAMHNDMQSVLSHNADILNDLPPG